MRKIETVRKTLKRLSDTIEAAAQSQSLSSGDLAALERDREFVASAIYALDSKNLEKNRRLVDLYPEFIEVLRW